METLTKVVTGQDITDDDRAEGWARAAEIGVNPFAGPFDDIFKKWGIKDTSAPQPQPIAPPTDPFWQLIDGAIARNMQPEQVISLKRLYDGTPAPTPAAPKAAKVKPEPPPVDAQTIVDRFRADLQTGLDIGLFNDSNVRQITKATGQAFLAVHMPQVWPTYQAHFNPTFDKQELNEAAKACGGEVSSTQKFQQGKTTITRKCLLISAQ